MGKAYALFFCGMCVAFSSLYASYLLLADGRTFLEILSSAAAMMFGALFLVAGKR